MNPYTSPQVNTTGATSQIPLTKVLGASATFVGMTGFILFIQAFVVCSVGWHLAAQGRAEESPEQMRAAVFVIGWLLVGCATLVAIGLPSFLKRRK